MLFVDHLVFIISEVGKTERFYTSFLGEPIRYDERSVVYLAGDTKLFFKLPAGESATYDKNACGLNHLAFGVESAGELLSCMDTLNRSQIKHSSIKRDKSGKDYIWFDDPDGYRIEFFLRGKDHNAMSWQSE